MATQSSKVALKKAVEAVGGTLEVDTRKGPMPYLTITADAPEGKVWSATGTHSIVSHADVATVSDLKDVSEDMYKNLLDDTEYGIEGCEEEDCDTCNNN
jgi:hypothetical protein